MYGKTIIFNKVTVRNFGGICDLGFSFTIHFPVVSQLERRAPFGVSVISHTIRHTVGLLWTSDQPVAEASLCLHRTTTYKHKRETLGLELAITATKRP
jgi:hypothetical protein